MIQRTPSQLRATAAASLSYFGDRRKKLLRELEEVEAQLRPQVLAAREMELPLRKIYELTGIAPNTTAAWERQARAAAKDHLRESQGQTE